MDPISIKTRTCLEWNELLSHLAALCHTSRGRAAAHELPMWSDPGRVEQELDLVSEARGLHDRVEPLPFGSISDLTVALSRLEKEGTLEAEVLLLIAETIEGGSRLRSFLQGRQEECPCLWRAARQIVALDDVSSTLREAFDEQGELADHASAELGPLRHKARELHKGLTRRMRTIMDEPYISKHLQDTFYTQREERYVLPVRTDSGSAVKGIVHGSSASGATIFVEPQEVVELNNKLKVAEMEVAREEYRILSGLCAMVRDELEAITENLELLQQLDVVDARARLSVSLGATRPRLSDDGEVFLQAMHHPLMTLSGKEVVKNDLELQPLEALIITGPNAGGKTVCLKTLGLCSLMLKAGMHLPAGADSRVPLYEDVLTEMGDDQSIEQSLSTFTAHLSNLLDFMETARPGTLVLLDEIGVGTDPQEGAALAQALLEQFMQTGGQLVVTTHFDRLKGLPVTDERFVNASVGFDLSRMQPTYRLHTGVPGSSGALDVARRLGLAPEVAERAAQLLSGKGQDLALLLTDLAEARTRLEEERAVLAEATATAQQQATRLKASQRRLEEKGQKALGEAHAEALTELKRARRELERVQVLLRRPKEKLTKERIKQADRQISEAAGWVRSHEPRQAANARAPKPGELVKGTRVLVKHLGGTGEVLEPPQRKKVTVIMKGGLKVHVALDQVSIPLGGDGKKSKPKGAGTRAPARDKHAPAERPVVPLVPVRTQANTLDVRGMRVDETLAEVDRFLDRGLRDNETTVFIIHGHGTGAMRSAIREYLAEQDLVEKMHAADVRDGGDGVTVVWLD